MPNQKWRRSVCCMTKGQAHIDSGMECQDYVDICEKDNYVIAALADGVGSKAMSHMAAVEAVKETINWFRSNEGDLGGIEQPDIGVYKIQNSLLPDVRYRIELWARDNGYDVRDMDCNLAFVFIRKHPEGKDRAYYGVLGDCAVCVIGATEHMYTICGAQPGSVATDSVMYPPSEKNFKVYHSDVVEDDIRGFLLTSDGLEYIAYVKGSPYVYHGAQDYYNAIFAPNPQNEIMRLFQKLQQNSFYSDDLSVAVLSQDDGARTFREDPNWLCQCGQRNNYHNLRCSKCKTEFAYLYKGIQKESADKGFPDTFEYFLYLNQHSDIEYTMLGLGPGIEPVKKNPPKKPTAPVKSEKPSVKTVKPTETPVKTVKTEKPPAKQVEPSGKSEENVMKKTVNPAQQGSKNCGASVDKLEKKTLLLTILSGASVVLILINLLLSGMGLLKLRQIRTMENDLNGKMQEVLDSVADVHSSVMAPDVSTEKDSESHMLRLADGSIYYGEVKNGVPHGFGFVESEGSIVSGCFINGVKDGTFLIRSQDDPQELSVVSYLMGSLVDGPHKIGTLSERADMLTSLIVNSELDVCADHSQLGTETWVIPADTMIYLTGEYYCKSLGFGGKTELWVKICDTDGQQGWCRATDLDMFER